MSEARDPRADDTNLDPARRLRNGDDRGRLGGPDDRRGRAVDGADPGPESGRARPGRRRDEWSRCRPSVGRDPGHAVAQRGRNARRALFGRLEDGQRKLRDGRGIRGDGRLRGLGGRRIDGRSHGCGQARRSAGGRGRPGWPCRATRSSRRSAEAAWASSTRPGTSGWIAWSR